MSMVMTNRSLNPMTNPNKLIRAANAALVLSLFYVLSSAFDRSQIIYDYTQIFS
jgi:hypothetical protein